MLPQYLFLLVAQLVNLVYQSYSMRRLRSLVRQEQLLQVRWIADLSGWALGTGRDSEQGMHGVAGRGPGWAAPQEWLGHPRLNATVASSCVLLCSASAHCCPPACIACMQEQTKAWLRILSGCSARTAAHPPILAFLSVVPPTPPGRS